MFAPVCFWTAPARALLRSVILRCMIVCGAIAIIPTAVSAQSLKDRRAQQTEQRLLEDEAAYTSLICETDLDVRIDWSAAGQWPSGQSLAKSCDGALSALEAVCREPGGKKRASRISVFICSADGSGPQLSGSALRYGASAGDSGFANTKAYLDEQLK